MRMSFGKIQYVSAEFFQALHLIIAVFFRLFMKGTIAHPLPVSERARSQPNGGSGFTFSIAGVNVY